MKLGLRDRVRLALGQDSSLVVSREEALKHAGFTTEYLMELGFTKADLKKLNRIGLLERGYVNPLNAWNKHSGLQTRWIFVISQEGEQCQTTQGKPGNDTSVEPTSKKDLELNASSETSSEVTGTSQNEYL